MHSIDQTADEITQALNPLKLIEVLQKYHYMFSSLRQVYDFINHFRHRSDSITTTNTPVEAGSKYNFTGQHSDIAHCLQENNRLPTSELYKIKNDSIRNGTYQSFQDAVKDGYVEISPDKQYYSLTPKGIEHTQSQGFIAQFEKDQRAALVKNNQQKMAYANLQGHPRDLDVFRYTDSINLNMVDRSNPEAYEHVRNYFHKCEQQGFVKIENNVITPTDKCKAYLDLSNPKAQSPVEPITSQNIGKVTEQMNQVAKKSKVQITKKAKSTVTKSGNKANFAAKVVSPAPSAGAAKAVVSSTKKMAATQTATAASTAVSSGSSAAATASTAASTGAATAGVGAVVTVTASAVAQKVKQSSGAQPKTRSKND